MASGVTMIMLLLASGASGATMESEARYTDCVADPACTILDVRSWLSLARSR